MSRIILLNKPYNVLCRFTDEQPASGPARPTLADLVDCPGVYPAGRLDRDSEGLVLLTDDGRLQHRIASPRHKLPKTYWVQLEGEIDDRAIEALASGVMLRDGRTRPAIVKRMAPPDIWPRTPPIRERRNIPTCWIAMTLTEGRNRQVRRMTAAVGFPTLRLIRWAVGDWTLEGLAPGQSRTLNVHLPRSSTKVSRHRPDKSIPRRTCRP